MLYAASIAESYDWTGLVTILVLAPGMVLLVLHALYEQGVPKSQ